MKHGLTAIWLALLVLTKTAAWKAFPDAVQADIWNASQSLLTAVLLILLGCVYGSTGVWLAVALGVGLELQTAACSVAYAYKPWPTLPGDELCSSGLKFPLGLASAAAGLAVVLHLYRRGK